MNCPLCKSSNTHLFHKQIFYRCGNCDLIFKDTSVWPSQEQEKQRYLKHHNSIDDKGYRSFLLELVDPLVKLLKPGMNILDYGCGPLPALSELVREKGFDCKNYDLYFYNNEKLFSQKYDFIICSEVVEHFRDPESEFKKLFGLLLDGGSLVVRTNLVPDDFNSWWYHSDLTHLVFYSNSTLEWIAKKHNAQLVLWQNNIVVMTKP